jgi:hypothetical protein
MYDLESVKILETLEDLDTIALCFYFSQAFASFDTVTQALVSTDLQYNINILVVFKMMVKFTDVLVIEAAVDFDLRHQLLPLSCLM